VLFSAKLHEFSAAIINLTHEKKVWLDLKTADPWAVIGQLQHYANKSSSKYKNKIYPKYANFATVYPIYAILIAKLSWIIYNVESIRLWPPPPLGLEPWTIKPQGLLGSLNITDRIYDVALFTLQAAATYTLYEELA